MSYIRTQAHRDAARKRKIGKNNHNYGKTIPDDVKEKIRNSLIGRKFTDELKRRISNAKKGVPYKNTPERERQLRDLHEGNKGEKSPHWKGGVNPLSDSIRKNVKMKQWKISVFTRDDYTCKKTSIHGGKINAHHIKSFSTIIEENNITTIEQALQCEELWDINNGITLSRKSHTEFHKKYGKTNNTKEQLDDFLINNNK